MQDKSPTVRRSLALLIVGAVLPGILMVALVISTYYQREQAQIAAEAVSRARAVASAVDREFGIAQAALRALATSPLLAKGDLAGFQAQAHVALTDLNAENIVLMDRTGQLLLTTARPFGTPLPKISNPALLQRMLQDGKPGVSDLFLGPVAGKLIYTIAVPVEGDGSILYSLNATVAPTQFLKLLTEQRFPDSWRASILDSSGSIVARTHEMQQFSGKKAVPDLLKRISASNEGSFENKTLEGIPVLTVFSRSAVTGWTVGIGAPLDEIKAGIRRTVTWLLVVTLAALGVGLSLAWFMGGRIARAFTELITPAKALGAGQPVSIGRLQIEEANQVADALVDAARRLDQANRAKADFLSSISHEFRTPLNEILGFSQLLETGSPPLTPVQMGNLNHVLNGGWHLLELVNEILNLVSIQADTLEHAGESIELAEILRACQEASEMLAGERGIGLTFAALDSPCLVHVDRSWLQQCLTSLVSNAIKYNRPGGAVAVECIHRSPGSIRVCVRDTGAGLSAEQLGQLFQPFNRLGRENLTEAGTGISLAATKRLVELMGGTIGVESTVGVGSVFWIELKLAAPPGPSSSLVHVGSKATLPAATIELRSTKARIADSVPVEN